MTDATSRIATINIPKLERNNFEEWFIIIESHARASGITQSLRQENTNLEDLSEKQLHAFWNLSHVMITSVGKDLSHLVKQMSKPDEWYYPYNIVTRIKREIRPHATAQRHALKRDFFIIQIEDGEEIGRAHV